jgi:hypothetical protein
LEEATYILRAMGQLRDVMKSEKGDVPSDGGKTPGLIKKWLSSYSKEGNHADGPVYPISPRNRIRDTNEPGLSTGNRNWPTEHASSRGITRWLQPIGNWRFQGNNIYQVENPTADEPHSFDYLQGTSGTTLDMINFFLAHGESVENSAKLMQAFYANWHAVAPDGNAHSQSESIGTMLQYLHRTNLQAPIMTPILGADDVKSMTGAGARHRSAKRETYATPLSEEAPGYLAYVASKAKAKEAHR